MKIGSLFTGIGGLELGVFNTVASIVPFNAQLVEVRPDTRLRCLPAPNRSRMDGRKSPGYSKRPSFYDLKYWSEDDV